jgi:hypothetical protein
MGDDSRASSTVVESGGWVMWVVAVQSWHDSRLRRMYRANQGLNWAVVGGAAAVRWRGGCGGRVLWRAWGGLGDVFLLGWLLGEVLSSFPGGRARWSGHMQSIPVWHGGAGGGVCWLWEDQLLCLVFLR